MNRRACFIGCMFALTVAAAALVPVMDTYAQAEVEIPIKCNETHCILPRAVIAELLDAHNTHVEKIRALEKNCGFKKDRDS